MTKKCEVSEVVMGLNTCRHSLLKRVFGVPDVTNSCRRAIEARGALASDELEERKG